MREVKQTRERYSVGSYQGEVEATLEEMQALFGDAKTHCNWRYDKLPCYEWRFEVVDTDTDKREIVAVYDTGWFKVPYGWNIEWHIGSGSWMAAQTVKEYIEAKLQERRAA